MKKIIEDSDNGRMCISLTPDRKMVQLELDKESCKFFIEELSDLLNGGNIEYDSDSGYSCGVLTKNSLGIVVEIRNNSK